jgi:hypothetical protein
MSDLVNLLVALAHLAILVAAVLGSVAVLRDPDPRQGRKLVALAAAGCAGIEIGRRLFDRLLDQVGVAPATSTYWISWSATGVICVVVVAIVVAVLGPRVTARR